MTNKALKRRRGAMVVHYALQSPFCSRLDGPGLTVPIGLLSMCVLTSGSLRHHTLGLSCSLKNLRCLYHTLLITLSPSTAAAPHAREYHTMFHSHLNVLILLSECAAKRPLCFYLSQQSFTLPSLPWTQPSWLSRLLAGCRLWLSFLKTNKRTNPATLHYLLFQQSCERY